MHDRWRRLAALLTTLALLVGIPIAVIDGDPSPGPGSSDDRRATPTPTVVAPTGPSGAAGELDSTPAEIRELRDDTPDSVPDQVLERAENREEQIAEDADLPPGTKPLPVAGAQGYSCRKDLTLSGTGSRGSARVMSFKLHYAVAHNIPGWGDVDGVGDYLERIGLATHLVVDFEGNCEQKVDFMRSAFTQVGFNSTSESVEIIAYGDETRQQWLDSPLIKKGILAAIVGDRLKARGLPPRFVDPVGCTDQLGYTDHNHLECGNDHHDVAPNFPFDVFQRQLEDGVRVEIVDRDRRACKAAVRYRHRRHNGTPQQKRATWKAKNERRQQARVKRLHGRGLYCSQSGAVKRKQA